MPDVGMSIDELDDDWPTISIDVAIFLAFRVREAMSADEECATDGEWLGGKSLSPTVEASDAVRYASALVPCLQGAAPLLACGGDMVQMARRLAGRCQAAQGQAVVLSTMVASDLTTEAKDVSGVTVWTKRTLKEARIWRKVSSEARDAAHALLGDLINGAEDISA